LVWKVKKEEPKVEVPNNEDLDLEELKIREQLRKLEEKKVVKETRPVINTEIKTEPEISKEEVYDMIQGNFNRGLYLLDVYRRM
jgi:regulator of replication initiation timing